MSFSTFQRETYQSNKHGSNISVQCVITEPVWFPAGIQHTFVSEILLYCATVHYKTRKVNFTLIMDSVIIEHPFKWKNCGASMLESTSPTLSNNSVVLTSNSYEMGLLSMSLCW